MLQDEDPDAFLAAMQKVINDPQVVASFPATAGRPPTAPARLGSEAFSAIEAAVKRNYETVMIPTMGTGATDMSYLRAKGMDCYGVGPATDVEDGPKGFGAHSDQERILETELHRWVRFEWEIVRDLARARLAG
jgi:acetylornithine deacetylase/succinyl-diaminopimelate desuccinylase-like protein